MDQTEACAASSAAVAYHLYRIRRIRGNHSVSQNRLVLAYVFAACLSVYLVCRRFGLALVQIRQTQCQWLLLHRTMGHILAVQSCWPTCKGVRGRTCLSNGRALKVRYAPSSSRARQDKEESTPGQHNDCIKWPTVENILCDGYLKCFVDAMRDPTCMDHLQHSKPMFDQRIHSTISRVWHSICAP